MSTPVIAVKPNDSVAYARRLMLRYRIGRLPVIDDNMRVVGIITLHDFVKSYETVLARRPLDQVMVSEIMTSNPYTVKPNMGLKTVADIMLSKGIGGLPVIDERGILVGIITKTDIVRAYAERMRGKYVVEEFMEKNIAVASPSHSISYVLELLNANPTKRVLVVDARRLVGIIAPSDIAFTHYMYGPLRKESYRRLQVLPKGRLGPIYVYLAPTAQDVMTLDPITVSPREDLALAASLMLRNGVSSIPVVEDDEPIGIVLKHNILAAIVKS